ncbi:MAG: AAA family ATPase [Chitinophagaceae bacterium]|nr:AAA family ATPase [Chitinophagaceae bacterium]
MKKIVIIGPESTGKSTLCQQLADHFGTDWVPEYAREYLLEHGTDYSYEDLLTIAKGQVALEEKYASGFSTRFPPGSPLFIDTDLYVMKVWCEFVFGKCHQWILDNIVTRRYDLYLLCNIDLPWVKDELREYPDLLSRQKLYHIYKDIMQNQSAPWVDISGNYEERFQRAQSAVKNLLAG